MTHPLDVDSRPRTKYRTQTVDYLDRARELSPRVAVAAPQIERDRRIPEALLDALHDAGFFRLVLPRSFDGGELDPVTFTLVIEEIAKADASTAWVLCQTAGCSVTAAYVPPDVARDIFGDRRAVMAWGPGPGARAVATDGGYRVTGTWSFASGGRHATWFGGYCPIYEPDGTPRRHADGGHEGRTMLFPASSARMTDVWHVIGLRGTASDSYSVSDLFVRKEYSMARDDASERRQPGALYCFPIVNLFASGFAGVALAIARASLDAFVALAHDKTPRGMSRTLRESAAVQAAAAIVGNHLARRGRSGCAEPRPACDHPHGGDECHPEREGRGRRRLSCRRRDVRLPEQRVRASLPRHAHGDPAAAGPPVTPRDGGS